jgi:gp16 family phage-associated protein
MEQKQLKTTEDVLQEFAESGTSVRSWAIANGLPPSVVHSLLKGRTTGRIGVSHKAAVLLGLKNGKIA